MNKIIFGYADAGRQPIEYKRECSHWGYTRGINSHIFDILDINKIDFAQGVYGRPVSSCADFPESGSQADLDRIAYALKDEWLKKYPDGYVLIDDEKYIRPDSYKVSTKVSFKLPSGTITGEISINYILFEYHDSDVRKLSHFIKDRTGKSLRDFCTDCYGHKAGNGCFPEWDGRDNTIAPGKFIRKVQELIDTPRETVKYKFGLEDKVKIKSVFPRCRQLSAQPEMHSAVGKSAIVNAVDTFRDDDGVLHARYQLEDGCGNWWWPEFVLEAYTREDEIEDENRSLFPVGMQVNTLDRHGNIVGPESYIGEYYTSGIPGIQHGSSRFGSSNVGVVKNHYKEYILVEYEDSKDDLVRLGFKAETLVKAEKPKLSKDVDIKVAFPIGGAVHFLRHGHIIEAGGTVPKFYAEGRGGIPSVKLIHGKTRLSDDTNIGRVTDHHGKYVIVEYKGAVNKYVRLGFKPESLRFTGDIIPARYEEVGAACKSEPDPVTPQLESAAKFMKEWVEVKEERVKSKVKKRLTEDLSIPLKL